MLTTVGSMSLPVALAAAVGSATAFGCASAAQHAAAHTGTEARDVDLTGLALLLKDPLWLLGGCADAVGLVLQLAALDQGAVSVVQPVQALGLLVALPVGALLGGPKGDRRTMAAAVLLVLAIGGFLALLGDPGRGHPFRHGVGPALSLGSLVLTALVLLATRKATSVTRAVVYGTASGVLFALTAVLFRVAALRFHQHGVQAFGHPGGLIPLLLAVAVGAVGLVVSQAGFQVGPLAASLPAMTAVDPFASVVLGRAALGERLPLGPGYVVAELVCLVAVIVAARSLALAEHRPSP